MAPHLGKRKRIIREELEVASCSPTPGSASEREEGEDIQDIFRRAFEAKFKPLEAEKKKKLKVGKEIEIQDEEEESDWSGISDEEEEERKVEVVDVSKPYKPTERMSKAELRAFMSSKPPTDLSSKTVTAPSKAPATKDGDDLLESSHLKNDVALQRLLRDSHLLSSNSKSLANPNLTLTGSLRHKSTDLHLQSLGAKKSIHAQHSMPMSHRKGISAKAQQREQKRRSEAKEAGIVLEKETGKKKKGAREADKDRGVGGPSVGKFRGGMLTLSKKDVRDITGSGGGRGKGKAKRGRR